MALVAARPDRIHPDRRDDDPFGSFAASAGRSIFYSVQPPSFQSARSRGIEKRVMAFRRLYTVFLLTLLAWAGILTAGRGLASGTIQESASRVESLLRQMTLEEKVGQLTLYTSDRDISGPSLRPGYEEDVRAGRVGAIFNAYGAAFTRRLQEMAVENSRLGVPLLFGYDVIHGHRTIFPIPLGEAASWDLEAIELSARIAAVEASAEGLHWTFAPMVDIARDPRWGRIAEGAGEDPYLAARIAVARVRGFQGKDLRALDTILACAKHFAAYGAAEAGRDYNTVDLSERQLREVYLPPFQAAVGAGVATIMSAFNEINGTPATASHFLMTEILRDEWGFEGFVVSDYTSIPELIPHGYAATEGEAARLAFQAGVDMDMQGGLFQLHLPALVRQSRVTELALDTAVRRVLEAKESLGLFEEPYRYSDSRREAERVLTGRHRRAAREVARKSIVLLKNESEILPLDSNVETLAVIGPLANNRKEVLGSWSAAGDTGQAVTLLEGIRHRVSASTRVLYAAGSAIQDSSRAGFEEALDLAGRANAVILALGEEALMSGEAASRAHLDLPGVQMELFQLLVDTGKPVVVVLMNGRPLILNEVENQAAAILETWFLGLETGNAVADVLFGDYNPSGRLPVSFPRAVGQIPIYYAHKNTGRPPTEQKYTSKYLDVSNEPLFPFGFGLSYTTFDYSDITLSRDSFQAGEEIQASVQIRNSGERAGHEVVQMYIQDLVGSVTRPVRELRGFEKIFLEPGQQRSVMFHINVEDLSFYRRDMSYGPEAGDFVVYIGRDSQDSRGASFRFSD